MILMRRAMVVLMLVLVAGCSSLFSKEEIAEFNEAVEAADKSYSLGLLEDAEMKYLYVLELRPNFHQGWLKLGNIYVRTGQFEAAIRAYSECIEAKPEEGKCWNNLAIVRVRQALATLEQGQKTVARESDDWFALDLLYHRLVKAITLKD